MKTIRIFLTTVICLLILSGGILIIKRTSLPVPSSETSNSFDGEKAYQHVLYQNELGPRLPGSEAHEKLIEYLNQTLSINNWQVSTQEFSLNGKLFQNVIAQRQGNEKWLIIAAHFDCRQFADRDLENSKRDQPVPGANDGASGVAVLLELARVLPVDYPYSVSLVFFDAEDQGGIDGQPWIMGSTYFANSLTTKPDAVILLDMVGDEDQEFLLERNSDKNLQESIWNTATTLGYSETFVSEAGNSILDDHVPFISLGIPAVDIIDFDYEYWHTTQDTPDHVTPASLEKVGNVVFTWLMMQKEPHE
jgi:Zn-dependent M28 family amino/carboxypeptidase